MYEVDKIRVKTIIQIIDKNLNYLKDKNIKSVDLLKENLDNYYSSSMALFTIQNKILELGEELIDNLDKNIYPNKYMEIPDILLREKIINIEIYKKFKSFIEYRNEIAHEYEGITENEIFWCIQNLDFVEEIMKIAKKELLKL